MAKRTQRKITQAQVAQEESKQMPGFVMDMANVSNVIDAGTYECVLAKVTAKKTSKQDDMLNFDAVIVDADDPSFNGKHVFANHVLTTNSLWALKATMVAFNVDPDIFEAPCDVLEESIALVGNRASAIVTLEPDNRPNAGDNMVNRTTFKQLDV